MIRSLLRKIAGENLSNQEEKYAKINIITILLMFVVSFVMLFLLPKEIPILHDGDVNYNVPTILGVWLVPVIAVIMNFTLIKQNRLNVFNTILFVIMLLGSTFYYITLM